MQAARVGGWGGGSHGQMSGALEGHTSAHYERRGPTPVLVRPAQEPRLWSSRQLAVWVLDRLHLELHLRGRNLLL